MSAGDRLITLRLLGGLTAHTHEGPLTGRATQKRRLALLALLAAGRGLSRDKVLALLWPEASEERARHLLSGSVYDLRQALGEDAILSAGDELRLNADIVASDVAMFRDQLQRGETDRAVATYGGSFLDGFFLSDAPEFERWAESERQRLAHDYADALRSLANDYARAGDRTSALAALRRLAAHEPTDARIALQLMQELADAGDRAGALRHARIYSQLLKDQFDAQPDPAITALAERLRAAPSSTAHTLDAPPVPAAAQVAPQPAEARAPAIWDTRVAPGRSTRPIFVRRLFPLAVLGAAIAAVTLIAVRRLLEPRDPEQLPVVAVLPFVAMPADGVDYLADGMTEELIGELAKITGLRVVARTSVFAFKGRATDIRHVARTLGATMIMEGSVRSDGRRLRITAQLIDAANGYEEWSQTYEREVGDIFAVQRSIAREVVGALRVRLTPVERQRIARTRTTQADAHTAVLKGRHVLNRGGHNDVQQAIAFFEDAIQRDSMYADAHAALAEANALLGNRGYVAHKEAHPRARLAAERALKLDSALAEAHTSLAYVLASERDFARALEGFRRAIRLEPSNASARHWYGFFLAALGRHDEALRELRVARTLDPLNSRVGIALGRALVYARRPVDAVSIYREVLALEPGSSDARFGLAMAYAENAQFAAAAELTKQDGGCERERPACHALLAIIDARLQRRDAALATVRRLDEMHTPLAQFYAAATLASLGERDAALQRLERVYATEPAWLISMRVEPWLAPLRTDARFMRLSERMGLGAPH